MKLNIALIAALHIAGGLSSAITRRQPTPLDDLSKRACWEGEASVGCSENGYCWKVCGGEGEWCWTAMNQGEGAWYKCTEDNQCYESMVCGKGDCDDCGCSC